MSYIDPRPRIEAILKEILCKKKSATCAWWTVNKLRLSDFVNVLHTGTPTNTDDRDTAAIKLRDWLLQLRSVGGSDALRIEVLGRTSTALDAFLKYRPLTKLYWRKDVKFVLPVKEQFRPVASYESALDQFQTDPDPRDHGGR